MYYFDLYGIVPLVPSMQEFSKRNCKTCDYIRLHLRGLTLDVCGKLYRLFALDMDRVYTPQEFIWLFLA